MHGYLLNDLAVSRVNDTMFIVFESLNMYPYLLIVSLLLGFKPIVWKFKQNLIYFSLENPTSELTFEQLL